MHILQNINATLSEEIKVNEWKNTESIINGSKTFLINIYTSFYVLYQGLLPINKKKAVMEGHKICQTLHFYN